MLKLARFVQRFDFIEQFLHKQVRSSNLETWKNSWAHCVVFMICNVETASVATSSPGIDMFCSHIEASTKPRDEGVINYGPRPYVDEDCPLNKDPLPSDASFGLHDS